jgi:hypothetical protein
MNNNDRSKENKLFSQYFFLSSSVACHHLLIEHQSFALELDDITVHFAAFIYIYVILLLNREKRRKKNIHFIRKWMQVTFSHLLEIGNSLLNNFSLSLSFSSRSID